MNNFGNRRCSHSHGQSHCPSQQQCSHNHGPSPHLHPPLAAGGAMGQAAFGTTVTQPGMEMMPSGFPMVGGGGVELAGMSSLVGGGGDGGGGGLAGVGDIEERLRGAPGNVLAAAERLSLISSASVCSSATASAAMDGIVHTAPGAESTDTGMLSAATLASQFLVAVRTRDLRWMRRLCAEKPENLAAAMTRRDGQGHTLMHWAAKAGDVEVLELLAGAGCPTTEYSTEVVGMSPLHWAATEGRLTASAWLLGPGGADPEGRDNQGCTALVIAAQHGFVELVIYLSSHGCDIASIDNVGDSALHWAAYKGHVPVLSMLIKAGQDPESRDTYGQKPLHLAALTGNLDAAEYLVLEAKANVNAKDNKNETPLDLALKKNQSSVELFLRTRGAGRSRLDPTVFMRLVSTPRMWMAVCETGRGIQGAQWPFPLNVFSMILIWWVLVHVFYGDDYVSLGHSTLLEATTLSLLFMLAAFMLTWMSNPGFVDPADPKVSAAFHRRLGVLTGKTSFGRDIYGRGMASDGYSDEEEEVEEGGAMEGLRRLEGGAGSMASSACYTCAIERPLRSRHCRRCRRCVRAFDHHCPFVANCVGAGNFRWFLAYILWFFVSAVLFVAMSVDYCLHVGCSWIVVASSIYAAFFGCFGFLLLSYQAQLVQKNLTSSEHHALRKVDYLQAPNHSGQYYNPFDQGCASNLLGRIMGTYDEPPPELLARLDAGEESRSELTHLV